VDNCGRVLIADPDSDFRASVSALLESVGFATREAATGPQALDALREERPALAVLDVHLPGVSGYQVCREIRNQFGDTLPIVFVSADRTEPADRVAGLLIGADDYVAKPSAADELLVRVRRLVARENPRSAPSNGELSSREREVLALLVAGRQRQEIASMLFITPKTVSKHIENIFRKLDVHTQSQAVARALHERLTEPGA